jgi:hypothetical protein
MFVSWVRQNGESQAGMEKKLQRTLIAAVCVFFCYSCGIFSPRDSEPPDLSGSSDQLNFQTIMQGTGYTFSKQQYEDIFTIDAKYEDFNSGNYPREQLIQKLQQLQRQLQTEKIKVQWIPGDIIHRNDTFYLNGLRYSVPDDSGSSDFVVVYDKDWQICQWRDVPAKQGKSFFSP